MTAFTIFPDNCLPPEGLFESRKALFKSINTYARPQGYAFTTGKSTTKKTGRTTITYAYDRGRQLPSLNRNIIRKGKRKTTTRITNYPFSVLAKESSEGWTLKHRPGARHALHNHEPSLHPSTHPVLRQLSRTPELKTFSNTGLAPKEIQTVVQENGSLATHQNIYNQIAKVRQENRQGQNPIHTLANQLENKGF